MRGAGQNSAFAKLPVEILTMISNENEGAMTRLEAEKYRESETMSERMVSVEENNRDSFGTLPTRRWELCGDQTSGEERAFVQVELITQVPFRDMECSDLSRLGPPDSKLNELSIIRTLGDVQYYESMALKVGVFGAMELCAASKGYGRLFSIQSPGTAQPGKTRTLDVRGQWATT